MTAGTIPEPNAILSIRRGSLKIPRSRSPRKTYLQSPAVHHPSIVPGSSPTRGSIVISGVSQGPHSVIRKLDFSTDQSSKPVGIGLSPRTPSRTPKTSLRSSIPLTNGSHSSPKTLQRRRVRNEDETLETNSTRSQPMAEHESYQLLNGGEDDEFEGVNGDALEDSLPEPEADLIPEPTPDPIPSNSEANSAKKSTTGKRSKPGRRPRRNIEAPSKEAYIEEENELEEPPPKRSRGRPKNSASTGGVVPAKASAKQTLRRKRESSVSKMSSPVQVQRGPPRPKNNKGLYILRRETPDDGFAHTRYGRNVIKPLAFWKNESVVYDESEVADGKGGNFLLPSIKEVIRAEEVEKNSVRRKKTSKASSKRKRANSDVEDEGEEGSLAEAWESEPGRIYGEIRIWNPEEEMGIEQEIEAEIALSAAAIITKDIPNSAVKFVKTLTLPFFGSGMVDLPPGAVKKPKNSRRMQMVFFVFTGRVDVTVNGNTFSIGKGGVWQVPRGETSFQFAI